MSPRVGGQGRDAARFLHARGAVALDAPAAAAPAAPSPGSGAHVLKTFLQPPPSRMPERDAEGFEDRSAIHASAGLFPKDHTQDAGVRPRAQLQRSPEATSGVGIIQEYCVISTAPQVVSSWFDDALLGEPSTSDASRDPPLLSLFPVPELPKLTKVRLMCHIKRRLGLWRERAL
eukprot:350941-Chlamydomonas_euryale.AAC.7